MSLSPKQESEFRTLHSEGKLLTEISSHFKKSPSWASPVSRTLGLPKRYAGRPSRPAPLMEPIIEAALQVCNIPRSAFMGKSRWSTYVDVRQIVMWVAHKKYGYSTPVIGRAIKRDHSTVLHGVGVVENEKSPEIKRKVRAIMDIMASHKERV